MDAACVNKDLGDWLWAGKTWRPVTEKEDKFPSLEKNRGAWGQYFTQVRYLRKTKVQK
jgi:hypothetical protein